MLSFNMRKDFLSLARVMLLGLRTNGKKKVNESDIADSYLFFFFFGFSQKIIFLFIIVNALQKRSMSSYSGESDKTKTFSSGAIQTKTDLASYDDSILM